jgi:hypothetical protein
MRCHTRNVNQTQVQLANNRNAQQICCLFCRVSIEFPCAVQRLAEDLFLLYDPYSKSAARGAFPPFLDIIAQNIPVVPLLVPYYVSTQTRILPVPEVGRPFPVMVPLPEVGNPISGTAFTVHYFCFLAWAPLQSQAERERHRSLPI